MKYFVLTYDRRSGDACIRAVFSADARAEAMGRRFALEATEAAANEDLEVVVLGAESEDDLRRTHERYFASAADLLSKAGSLSTAV